MKNKGFTLVELIITITLIAIISVSIGVSVTGLLSRQEDDQAEEFKKTISDAACVYAELNNITTTDTITVQELIDAGTDILVSGSGILESEDYSKTIKELRK